MGVNQPPFGMNFQLLPGLYVGPIFLLLDLDWNHEISVTLGPLLTIIFGFFFNNEHLIGLIPANFIHVSIFLISHSNPTTLNGGMNP